MLTPPIQRSVRARHTPPTSASGLASPVPHLRRNWLGYCLRCSDLRVHAKYAAHSYLSHESSEDDADADDDDEDDEQNSSIAI